MPLGTGALHSLADTEKANALRVGLFALERAMGATINEIARKYQVTKDEVETALSSAERLQFIEAYRDLVRDRLVPQALVVYEFHLRQGSLEAAKAILEGVGVLTKPSSSAPVGPNDEVESLMAYRIRRGALTEQSAPQELPLDAER